MPSKRTNLACENLDRRLNCFGEFNRDDPICLKSCALNINCAIAKNQLLGFQLLDDSGLNFNRFDVDEIE